MARLKDDRKRAEQCVEILKAVAHPLRLRIVAVLCDGDQHVNGLCEQLAAPQSVVSQQLRILRMRQLVSATRRAGFAWYSLAEPRLVDLVCCVEGCGLKEEVA